MDFRCNNHVRFSPAEWPCAWSNTPGNTNTCFKAVLWTILPYRWGNSLSSRTAASQCITVNANTHSFS